MGMRVEEARDFFILVLKKLGFRVDSSGCVIEAERDGVIVTIRFRELQNAFMHIPRTEVLIESPEYVHEAIRQHIMRSKAGG